MYTALSKVSETGFYERELSRLYCNGPVELNYQLSEHYIDVALNKGNILAITDKINRAANNLCALTVNEIQLLELFNKAEELSLDKDMPYVMSLKALYYLYGIVFEQNVKTAKGQGRGV